MLRVFGRDVRSQTARAASGSPEVIVDLLTGAGIVLSRYARRFPEARIITVDLNPRLLSAVSKSLKRQGFKNVETIAGDARELPMPASQADLVNISFGLHELKWLDRELILGEACRILKPGGELIVADYRELSGPVRRAMARVYFILFEPRWIAELFCGGLQGEIADAGFQVEKVRDDLPITRLIVARKVTEEVCMGGLKLVR